jgi:hypothetical protein
VTAPLNANCAQYALIEPASNPSVGIFSSGKIPTALIGFRLGEATLLDGALGSAGRRGLSHRGSREQECPGERQPCTLNAMKFHSPLPLWSYFTFRLTAGMGIHNSIRAWN